jgi:hypothetical protein
MEMGKMVRNTFHVRGNCDGVVGDGEYMSKINICLKHYQLFVE